MSVSQISAIIASAVIIASIASTIITAFLNNQHQMNLRKLELREDRLRNSAYHKRDILENYLKYAGQIFYSSNPQESDAFHIYCSYYLQARLYVDEETSELMEEAHIGIIDPECDILIDYLMGKISNNIRELIKTLLPD